MCFHKFTKLTAETVARHGRADMSAQGVTHEGPGKGGVKNHGAGQGSRAVTLTLERYTSKGRPALNTADQALRR